MSLGPFIPRRNDLLGDRHPLHGLRGQLRGVRGIGGGLGGGLGGDLGGGLGGLRAARWGGGFDPLVRYADLGGMGGLRGPGGLGGLGPLGARRDILGPRPGLADPLHSGRYPDLGLGRRALDDLHISSCFGPHGLEGLLALNRFDRDRGLCDGRGCRGVLGCGFDHRCEHERRMYNCSGCSGGSSSSSSIPNDLKTKDILIRGKTYKVRKSFLVDAGKFEADVGKYLEKKSEEACPNNVVEMLIDFINTESCNAKTLLDLVTMNVLASSLGVKSAGEYSLNHLKKYEVDYDVGAVECTQICVAVLLSGKVDDKLTEWLKKYLKYDQRWLNMARSSYFFDIVARKPELELAVAQLMGVVEKDDREDGLRIL